MTQSLEQFEEICEKIIHLCNNPAYSIEWSAEEWDDWQFVCRVHGVAPLLYSHLTGMSSLPKIQHDWLAAQYFTNQQRIQKIHEDVALVLHTLSQENIPCIPLKGTLLTAHYYHEAIRPMADIDLLVQPDDLSATVSLLLEQGYIVAGSNWKHIQLIRKNNTEVVDRTCEHADNPRGIDLHINIEELFGGLTVNLTEHLWQNSHAGSILGESARILTPDMLWLHLIVHTSSHLWGKTGRMIQLFDIKHVTAHVENPQIAQIANPFGYIALWLLNQYFPDVIINSILNDITPATPKKLQDWTKKRNFVNTSWLSPQTRIEYLRNLATLWLAQPQSLKEALQFLFASNVHIVQDDPVIFRQSEDDSDFEAYYATIIQALRD